jgi:hypothetical protein
VRGLDTAVVAEHAGHVVAPAYKLAHGAARADLGPCGARLVGQRDRGCPGVDAARVGVDPALPDGRGEQRLELAQRLAGQHLAAFAAEDQAGMRLAVEGERGLAALVQLQQQLERALADRLHLGRIGADHEAVVAARGGLCQPGGLAQRDAEPAPRTGSRHGDADDATAHHDDVGRAAHSRPASAA